MNDLDLLAFAGLFRATCARCFGKPVHQALSEAESRHLSREIEDRTGLVVGWKSLKNYAAYVFGGATGKSVNPSVATLDTLARYVAGAPVISEAQRKTTRYVYWFRYREQFTGATTIRPRFGKWPSVLGGALLLALVVWICRTGRPPRYVTEDFHSVEAAYLEKQGWQRLAPENAFWERRGEKAGQLTLFTLLGDNWPKAGVQPRIHNLLLQKTPGDRFSAEVQFSDFMPRENWQQAGLLLLEDTCFIGKSIRLSLAYNDFFGGYDRPGEMLVQAIAAYGQGHANLEEIVHQPLFVLGDTLEDQRAAQNLRYSAVRIEKQGRTFRLLYATGPTENFSFKQAARYDFDMTPRYVGIFALKGLVDSAAVIPVAVRHFQLEEQASE